MKSIFLVLCFSWVIYAQSPGDIIITEFFPDPVNTFDSRGEFIELYNNTDNPIDLTGWKIVDDDTGYTGIFYPHNGYNMIMAPRSFYVLSPSNDPVGNGSFTPDYTYGWITDSTFLGLNGGDDEIVLKNPQDIEIARAMYTNGRAFNQSGIGVSFELKDLSLGFDGVVTQANNDFAGSTHQLSATNPDRGTPGYFASSLASPVLNSPANNAIDLPLNVTLSWNTVATALTYRLQVSSNNTFTNIIFDDSTLTLTSKVISGLIYNTQYFWRVRAKNSSSTSNYSAERNFTTIIQPLPPVLYSPVNNFTGTSIQPRLTWFRVNKAGSYRLQVSLDNTFSSIVFDDSTITDSSKLVTLPSYTQYFWRVNSKNAGGTSVYSSVWNFTAQANPPSVPVLALPLDNELNQPINLSLRWFSSTGASTYRVQIAADQNFNNLIVNDSTITDTLFQAGSLSYSTQYFWRVNAKNNEGTSAYSLSRTFTTMAAGQTAPAAPVLLSPENNAVNQPVSITFNWNASAGAEFYRLQVSRNSTFSRIVFDDSTITTVSKLVNGLSYNLPYFWRVLAKNSAGSSPYSAVRTFTTMVAPPGAPTLVSPANNAVNQPVIITLSWSLTTGAQTYRLQVSESALFDSFFFDDSTLTGTSQIVGPLKGLTRYYWRVSAKNTSGTSGWSAVRKFNTANSVPSAPVLLSPSNNSNGISVNPTLSWNAVTGAESYHLQVSIDSLFSSLAFVDSGITLTNRTIPGLTYLTKYFWRVRAKNSSGYSLFSSAWNFTTINATSIPNAPVLVSPPNNSSGISVNALFAWNRSQGSTTYRLQAASDSLFTNLIFNDSTIIDSFKLVGNLNFSSKYFWRVNAKNSAGTSNYSSVWNFTTGSAPSLPAVPILISPANNSTNMPLSLNLYWNKVLNADKYRLQLSSDSAFQNILLTDSLLTDTIKAISSLNTSQKYFWRVRSENVTGSSQYSAGWNFTTLASAPSVPVLNAPADSALNLPISIIFEWNPSQNAQFYRLQVSRNPGFTRIVFDDSTITASSKNVGGLLYNLRYYWRVLASNAAGNSPYSVIRTFTTMIAPPTAPGLVSPANNAIDQPLNVSFVWNAVSNASTYNLQVSLSIGFETFIYNDSTLTGTSQAVGPLNYNTRYYWRVNAKNSSGTSPWSAIRKFNTIISAPAPILLVNIYSSGSSVKAETSDNRVMLSWTTEREYNLADFEIERSIVTEQQGKNKDRDWKTISSVKASGNSSSLKEYKFVDKNPFGGNKFMYRLKQNDKTGNSIYSNETEIEIIPVMYELYQNYPNPFNPVTHFKFALPIASNVKIIIYNALGETVQEAVNKIYESGIFNEEFSGAGLSSGVYFYSIYAKALDGSSDYRSVKKMIIMK